MLWGYMLALATWWASVPFVDNARIAYALAVPNWAQLLNTCVYVLLWGTLPTPLGRPFRGRIATVLLLGIGLASILVIALWPTLAIVAIEPAPFVGWNPVFGPWPAVFFPLLVLISVYGSLVAFDAWRRAPKGSASRQKSAAFLAAFLWQDLWFIAFGAANVIAPAAPRLVAFNSLLPPLGMLIQSGLLAYGILKFQLFDIDLKIKWGISRGTVATIFIAVFFVIAVTAENFLTDRFGWALGGVVAGLLLFAIAPLQRFGERVANAALPNVHDTDEYRLVRKQQVYQAAYEAAMQDGLVTDKERDVLAALQDQLGLGAAQARRIEKGAL